MMNQMLSSCWGPIHSRQKVVVYCRVSSQNQKDDLKSQIMAMEPFCLSSGIAVDEWVDEIGGGMKRSGGTPILKERSF